MTQQFTGRQIDDASQTDRPTITWSDLLMLSTPPLLFILLATYQLGLPGLHYDEAKEAGVNAMELAIGQPVTAFRDATVSFFGHTFPLMVQDYIGSINVLLALPLLTISGIGVPNLRFLSIITALLAMLFLTLAIAEWTRTPHTKTVDSRERSPISFSACLVALVLLAFSPSFIFWSRQGIFVTNLMQPLAYFCIWQGLRWMRTRQTVSLLLCAFSAGWAIYAKLQAIWVVGPFGLLLCAWSLWQQRKEHVLTLRIVTAGSIALLLPLLPLLLFNLNTGGLGSALLGNASESYYGVNNLAIGSNFAVRWSQLGQVLRGEQFWYLGGSFQNRAAPIFAAAIVLLGLWHNHRRVLPPLLLLALIFCCTLFTISDLFITHFALVQPLIIATVAIAFSAQLNIQWTWRDVQPALATLAIIIWIGLDLISAIRYHRVLGQTGGLADHSDATYHLAYHLRYNGMGAPITLDWGIEAPIRYLTEGTVRPIEIFGYDSLTEPDSGFPQRMDQFLQNSDNVYLLRAPGQTVFAGRREAFIHEAQRHGRTPILEQVFTQRDSVPLFELWRLE